MVLEQLFIFHDNKAFAYVNLTLINESFIFLHLAYKFFIFSILQYYNYSIKLFSLNFCHVSPHKYSNHSFSVFELFIIVFGRNYSTTNFKKVFLGYHPLQD